MKTKQKNKSVLMLGCFGLALVLGGVAGAEMQLQPEVQTKQILILKLSSIETLRAEQEALLATLDVLGKNFKLDVVQVQVDAFEEVKIHESKFEILEATSSSSFVEQSAIEKYRNPAQMAVDLAALQQRFPNFSRLMSIGKTTAGRDIWAIEISSKLDDTTRPTILYNAMHHARELMTAEVGFSIAQVLLEGYSKDNEITKWLNSYRVIVVPQVNPDGNDIVHSSNKMWRKNAFKQNARVVGVDINRNYPTLWNGCNGSSGSSTSDTYRGPSAGSEPEVQAMMNLVLKNRPVMNISYHSFSEMVLHPFGCSNQVNTSLQLFRSIGSEIKAGVLDDDGKANTYELGSPPEILYQADGSDMDWQWREAGVLAFAMEINSMWQGFQPDFNRWSAITTKRQEGGWKALLRRMERGGFRASAHTLMQLGKVTYRVEATDGESSYPWADDSVKPFQMRNDAGLVFHILDAGQYKIHVFVDGKEHKVIPVTIGEKTLDIGIL